MENVEFILAEFGEERTNNGGASFGALGPKFRSIS